MKFYEKKRFVLSLVLFGLCLISSGEFFESFEGLVDTERQGSTTYYSMTLPGWETWEPRGGRGWAGSWAGRQPMPGWMSGTNEVPPAEGAGTKMAYVTYTHGGSKTNDNWLVTPTFLGSTANTELSFWYRSCFSNFADRLYVMISTNEVADDPEDFTIQADYRSFPRAYPSNGNFPPWTNIVVDVGALVPAGAPFRVAFREYYNNNWYDVRANELDVIRITDVYAEPTVSISDVRMSDPTTVEVDYELFVGYPTGTAYLCWGPAPDPLYLGGWNSVEVSQPAGTGVISNFPSTETLWVRACVRHQEGDFYSKSYPVYAGDADGEGYLFESFETLGPNVKMGTQLYPEMPPAGWEKWQAAGGRGWAASWAGRQPFPGWMSGANSVPPTEGAGNQMAYATYTMGGSKTNDLWLVSPKLEDISSDYELSFWYRSSYTNFADHLYLMISTDPEADSPDDFTIQGWHRSFPRGDMANDFAEPWQKVTVDVGSMVPEGSDIRVAFREYYNNNWYDVRAIELDVISGGSRPHAALRFDGVDDRVRLPLTNAPTEYTIETWVKPLASGAQNLIVRSHDNPLIAYSQQLRINSAGQFEHYVYDGAEKIAAGSTVVLTGRWYHVAGTAKNDGTLRLIVNGQEEGTPLAINTMFLNTLTNVWLGAATGHGMAYLNGELDEVRFWDHIRTTHEIADTMNVYLRGVETGLTACYRMDRTFGTDLYDSSDLGSGAWFNPPTDSKGWKEAGDQFNGIDDLVTIPTAQSDEYSIEAWVRTEKTGAQNIMVFTDGNPQNSYNHQLRITSDGHFQHYLFDGSARYATAAAVVQPNTWYHVAGTGKKNDNISLFVDGDLVSSTPAGNTTWGNETEYQLGTASRDFGWFQGTIRDVIITNRIKDSTEFHAQIDPLFVTTQSPSWSAGGALLGDSIAAQQWHPRGLWQDRTQATAARGLSASSSVSGNTNYLVFGDNGLSGVVNSDLSAGVAEERLSRVWHFDLHGATAQTADLLFDPAVAGGSVLNSTNDYSLLRRDGTTGNFSILRSSANTFSGGEVSFLSVPVSEGYYTLGSPPPAAPTALAATNITAYAFDANWSAVSPVSGYQLDASTHATFSSFVDGYVARALGEVTTASVTGLLPGVTYHYRVRSVRGETQSADSASKSARTLTEGSMELLPQMLTFSAPYGGNPVAQTFAVSNAGQTEFTFSQEISYGASASNWLTITPLTDLVSGGDSQVCTANVSSASLSLGTYSATSTVSSATATNAPQPLAFSVTVTQAVATVVLNDLTQTYTGSPRVASVTTDPAGLVVNISYNGSGSAPTDAGTYAVTATVSEVNYVGEQTGTLTVNRANQTIHSFTPADGTAFDSTQVVTLAATASSGLPVTLELLSGPARLYGADTLRFTGAGNVQVRASQAGDANRNPVSQEHTYSITDDTPLHYVALAGQTPYPPYASWATAASNIQDAVDIAVAMDTVIVSNGIYQVGATNAPMGAGSLCRVVVDKAITLQSVNGQAASEIRGGLQTRGVYLGNGAVLSGFAVARGTTGSTGDQWIDQSGGGVFINTTGAIENCRIENNTAAYNGGGVYLYEGGSADRLTVVSNSAYYGGGISSVRGGTLRNSLLVHNVSSAEGGGAMVWWDGDVVNCTFSENTATGVGDGALFYQGGELYNSILFGNGDSEVYFKEYTPVTANNYTSNPLFHDGFRLSAASPCVDAGLDAFGSGMDLAGRLRTIGAHPDIGAFETPQSRMSLELETNLLFQAVYGGENPLAQSVVISNSGGHELWFTSTNATDWLTVSPASALLAPGGRTNLLCSAQLNSLNAGSYQGSNWIESATASNAPQHFVVQLDVEKAAQTISGFTPTNGSVFLTTNTVELSATASSGLSVSFTNTGSDIVRWHNPTSVTFSEYGTAEISARQLGNVNYTPAPALTHQWTIHGVPVVGTVSFERVTNEMFKTRSVLLLTNSTDPEGANIALSQVDALSASGYPVRVEGRWLIYSPPSDFSGTDSFSFSVTNEFGGRGENMATLIVKVETNGDEQTVNIVNIVSVGGGEMAVRFAGIPGRIYNVQATETLAPTAWTNIGTTQIGTLGYAIFVDSNAPPSRFYRTTRPE